MRFDNHQCRFEPHVTMLRTTQTLVAGNKDPVGHNTNLSTLKNPPQNILIPAMGEQKLNFPMDESLPTTVNCNIHPWMKSFVVIKDHPYMGVSDKDGKVTIKNVPAGKWTFQFWQEAAGYVSEVELQGQADEVGTRSVGGRDQGWRKRPRHDQAGAFDFQIELETVVL